MDIDNLESISLEDFQYKKNLDTEQIIILCSPDYTEYYPSIKPITVIKNGTFFRIEETQNKMIYGAKFKESSEEKHETLTNRFFDNELFRVSNFNDNYKDDGSTPFFAFGNATHKLESEIVEIYEGDFDMQQDYFVPKQPDIFDLLSKKNDSGQRSYFYISDKIKIYGPFNCNGIDGQKVKLTSVHNNDGVIYEWERELINELCLEFQTYSRNSKLLNRSIVAKWLPQEFGEKIKFLPNDELLNHVIKKVKLLECFSKSEIQIFKKIHNAFSNGDISDDDKVLYERATNLLNQSLDNKTILEKFIEYLPQTKTIQQEIYDLEIDKDKIFDAKASLEQEREETKHEVQSLNEQKQDLIIKIEQLKTTSEEIQCREIEEARNKSVELQKVIQENEVFSKELEKIEKYKNLKQLDNEIEDKEAEKRILERQKQELTVMMKSLRQEFIDTQKEANEKLKDLIKAKTHFDFISGRDFTMESNDKLIAPIKANPSNFYEKNIDMGNYVSHEKMLLDTVTKELKKCGRDFPVDFVANLLVSVHQNMFTIFAGLPGTGKTSLARILSKIFVSDPVKRIEIPVAKGWTSQKDFIGFYNPLSKKFSETNQKMYQLLDLANRESKKGIYQDTPLSYIILDEANLSPIEHYWSSFYNLTDSAANEGKLLSINLGSNINLQFPNNLRFIGTINSDQTTEELSPRILDRVNIIRIPEISQTLFSVNYDLEPETINEIGLTLKDVIKMFNLRDFENKLQDDLMQKENYKDILKIYNKFKDQFRELNINISPRLDIAFTYYCTTAFKFMNQYKALDYFIAQRILTKIDGQGEKYRDSLKELKNNLERTFRDQRIENSESVKLLDLIIEFGSNEALYENYNYFLVN